MLRRAIQCAFMLIYFVLSNVDQTFPFGDHSYLACSLENEEIIRDFLLIAPFLRKNVLTVIVSSMEKGLNGIVFYHQETPKKKKNNGSRVVSK